METDNQKLLQDFLLAYIANLNTSKDGTKFRNDLVHFRTEIETIMKLFGKTAFEDLDIKKFLDEQAQNVLINKNKLDKTLDNDKQLIDINMHGEFIKEDIKIVPENVVLIFLTPLNRTLNLNFSHDILNDTIIPELSYNSIRNKLLNNIFCLDKLDDLNSSINNSFYKNSLILYPNQVYYNILLSYGIEDLTKFNYGIYNYNNKTKTNFSDYKFEEDEYLTDGKNNYYTSLSSLINILSSQNSQILNYLLIRTCRELNIKKLTFKTIYSYENFSYYFNTIISNCKNIKFKISLKKNITFGKHSNEQILYVKILNKYIDDFVDIIKYSNSENITKYSSYYDFNNDDILKLKLHNEIKIKIDMYLYDRNDNHFTLNIYKLYILLCTFIHPFYIYILIIEKCKSMANLHTTCSKYAFNIISYYYKFNKLDDYSYINLSEDDYNFFLDKLKKTNFYKKINNLYNIYKKNLHSLLSEIPKEFKLAKKTGNPRRGHLGRIELPKLLKLLQTRKQSEKLLDKDNVIEKTYNLIKDKEYFKGELDNENNGNSNSLLNEENFKLFENGVERNFKNKKYEEEEFGFGNENSETISQIGSGNKFKKKSRKGRKGRKGRKSLHSLKKIR